jgi:peptide/nickel transport system substrate-binding protein
MRKRLVSLIAVLTVLVLLLAACSKPADKGTTPEPAKEAPKPAVLHSAWPYEVPPKTHFNVFATNALTMSGSMFTDLMNSPLALYYWHNDSWEPQLATDWKVDTAAQTITVNLRKGVKWSDGSEFKAQDVLNWAFITWGHNGTVWRYADKVTAPNDYQVVYHLSNVAPIALRYILKGSPAPTSVYGEWANKYKALFDAGKAQTADEVKALTKDFDAFRPKDYVASGPFHMDVDKITEAQLTLTKRPDAWNADKVKIDQIVIYAGETEQATPLVLGKKVDFVTHAFPPATEQQFVSMGLRIIRFPYYTGPGLYFNQKVHPFEKVEFRQALAYAIDRKAAGMVALGNSGIPVKKMAGMSDNMLNQWVPADVVSKLNEYNLDLKKAEQLLTSIGFKKDANGQWLDDTGKKLELELYAPSDFTDWMGAATNMADQLTKFGIKTAVRGPAWSQYTTDVNAGKFQMGLLPWGSSTPHPQFAFLADFVTYNLGGQKGDKEKPGMNFTLKTKYSAGDVDIDQLITDSGKGMDTNAQKVAIGKLALAFNELLPGIPVFERYSNAPILDGVNVTGWPKEGAPELTNGSGDSFATILVVTGQLKGVGK